ncbi:UV radiation resistance protein and autophagy-related subunit 14-domain-containing protein [Pisolithus croceorrhizus]|nr:UV radiation resistance protein and autophagy-related subunit 14-domain-containing protein [Pisolithus croceorrhizus]
MECSNCELRQRQFYCESCLRNHLRDFRRQTQHFAKDRDEQVTRATRALRGVEGARLSRAAFAAAQRTTEELAEALGQLKRENEAKRDRVRLVRESVAARRRTLSAARLLSAPPLDGALTRETQALHVLSSALARARSGLVQELVEVFSVVEVGGRPALGGRAGVRGEWTVGGLVLPVPGDIQRLSYYRCLFRIIRTDVARTCRLPSRSHQCSSDVYDTLPRLTSLLLGCETAL